MSLAKGAIFLTEFRIREYSRRQPLATTTSSSRRSSTTGYSSHRYIELELNIMSQDYQHACERAELLGLAKPSEEEWRQTQSENRCDDDEDGALQDLDYADETAERIGGGLDELNSILSTTQKKLNRFKTVCGSLGTLLKVKVASRGGTPHHKPEQSDSDGNQEKSGLSATDEVMTVETSDDTATDIPNDPVRDEVANSGNQPKQIDLSQKMGSHLDKLDSLITKADNAQYSMQHQTKQMRKFLKK